MIVFLDVELHNFVEIYRRFGVRLLLALMMEAVSTSETSVFATLNDTRSEKTVSFILAAVRTWNLTLWLNGSHLVARSILWWGMKAGF
jgi:hypothetical protein